ncbi:MAG: PhzF family phenazine biosynthesis protein [Immundisolibacteraceae bacterium]|nr:PhzF family phenazine biosynthesis protein [Immundisolibacteraceae bacterium]
MDIQYFTADAFSNKPFQGAQIAVVPAATALSGEQTQILAAEFNLSETVFVTSIENNQRLQLRAFSPREEVTVIGHPLIAAAHVVVSAGELSLADGTHDLEISSGGETTELSVIIENGAVSRAQYRLTVTPRVDRFVPSRSELASILTLDVDELDSVKDFRPLLVAAPQPYLVLALKDHLAVKRARFDFHSWSHSTAPSMLAQEILLVANQAEDPAANFHARLLGPAIGVNEDPPVGSAIPALAAWLCDHEHIRRGTYPLMVERGSQNTRHSLLQVEIDNQGKEHLQMRIGGNATLVSEGRIRLPQ